MRAAIAESYERIHRNNLVGMGVLPLQFKPNESAQSLGLTGLERYDILGIDEDMRPGQDLAVRALRDSGEEVNFSVLSRIDTPVELDYYRQGGVLQAVLQRVLETSRS